MMRDGRYDEAIAVYDEAVKSFPGGNEMAEAREMVLAMAGENADRAIAIMERWLTEGISDKKRGSTIAQLCFLYDAMGQTEKAEKLARSRPHTRESREILLPNFLPQPERDEYLRSNLPYVLTDICRLIKGENLGREERLRNINLGVYSEIIDPAKAMKTIAEFLS